MEHMEREYSSPPREHLETLDIRELQSLIRQGTAYPDLYEHLHTERTMEPVIKHLKEVHDPNLESLDFLNERDWDLIAFLELFDPHLLEHSLKTYEIAKHKVEKELLHGVILARAFEREGVRLDQFYRTCLFHDIGKVTIPYEVLNVVTTPQDELILLEKLVNTTRNATARELIHLDPYDSHIYTVEELNVLLHTYNLRPFNVLPARTLLPPHALETLIHAGFSPDEPFARIIEHHEAMSETILQKEGFPLEASLAGHHHNYRHERIPYRITLESLQISIDIADIIRLADTEQALGSTRSYKHAFSKLSILETLVHDAEAGRIGKEITYLWIHDEFSHMDIPRSEQRGGVPSREEQQYVTIKAFLDQGSRHMGTWIPENFLVAQNF